MSKSSKPLSNKAKAELAALKNGRTCEDVVENCVGKLFKVKRTMFLYTDAPGAGMVTKILTPGELVTFGGITKPESDLNRCYMVSCKGGDIGYSVFSIKSEFRLFLEELEPNNSNSNSDDQPQQQPPR